MRTNRKLQNNYNFQKLNIGSGELPPIDYITPLSSYRDNYEHVKYVPTLPDVYENIQYCTDRIEDDDLSYGESYSGIPPFDEQPPIEFGASGDIPELLRKYYFLKYYLYYNPGKLAVFGDLPNIEWSAVSGSSQFDSLVDDFISNVSADQNYAYNSVLLDDFEQEYQAFITTLRNRNNMSAFTSTDNPSVYLNEDEYDYTSGFSGQE